MQRNISLLSAGLILLMAGFLLLPPLFAQWPKQTMKWTMEGHSRQQWEYRVLPMSEIAGTGDEADQAGRVESKFNELGTDDWEFCQIHLRVAVLKRPKETGATNQGPPAEQRGSVGPLGSPVKPDAKSRDAGDHLPQEDDFGMMPPEALEGMPFAGNAASRAVEPNVKISVPKDAWGDVTRGLRLGVLADPDSVRVGETIPLKLVVENMSDQAIAFVVQEAQADVRHPNQDQVPTSKIGYSGLGYYGFLPRRKRYLLEPGERTVVAEPSLAMVDSKDDCESKPGLTKVILTGMPRMRNHMFFVRYAIRLEKDRDPLREDEEPNPEKSNSDADWSGTLTSGTIGVVASRPAQEATGDDVGNSD
jgi:hypothetical protein